MTRNFTYFFLILIQAFTPGCIHVKTYETRAIELPSEKGLSMQQVDDLKIGSIVYLPSKLPLEDFFSRLRRGEFSDAFAKMDLNYKQSNTNDELIQKIIEAGFIPAYIEVKNTGEGPISIDEKTFALDNGKNQIKGFYADSLPREFERFSPTAVAANAVNLGIVIVGFAVVLAAMIILPSGAHFPDTGQGSSSSMSNDPLNKTSETTKIDYKNYLLTATKIMPGESAKGLLFFYFENKVGIHDYKLIVTMPQTSRL